MDPARLEESEQPLVSVDEGGILRMNYTRLRVQPDPDRGAQPAMTRRGAVPGRPAAHYSTMLKTGMKCEMSSQPMSRLKRRDHH